MKLTMFEEFLLTIITFFVFILWLFPIFIFKAFNNNAAAGLLYIPIIFLTGFWINFIITFFKNREL